MGYIYFVDQLFNHAVPVHVLVHVAVDTVRCFINGVLETQDLLDIFEQINAVAVVFDRAINRLLHDERRLLER